MSVSRDLHARALEVEGLSVDLVGRRGATRIVDDVSFKVSPGETLGIVGESGSGKSITVRAMLGLVPSPPIKVSAGRALFGGRDLLTLGAQEMRHVRGAEIGVVFQDPLASLNPLQRCGDQIEESLRAHTRLNRIERHARVIELLRSVGIPDPASLARRYPHEFSGGMRQRVMIAIAMANDPVLLIADEPTTALDVTIQAQVMQLFRGIGRRSTVSIILISHDLGLIAENCDRILVLYSGRVMETGLSRDVLSAPSHPYTRALISARPKLGVGRGGLEAIPGRPPTVGNRPSGCPFHPRCTLSRGRDICAREVPALRAVAKSTSLAACHFAEEALQSAEPALTAGATP
jgi:oligopeptide/dipeptide ABC transporter ATP-binding protein